MPLAAVADKTTKLPCGKFELNDEKRSITPSAGFDELVESSGLSGLVQQRKA